MFFPKTSTLESEVELFESNMLGAVWKNFGRSSDKIMALAFSNLMNTKLLIDAE